MKGVQKSFFNALEVVDKSLSLIFENAKSDELTKPKTSPTRFANLELQRGNAGAAANSRDVPISGTPRSTSPATPDPTDPRGCPGKCYPNMLLVLNEKIVLKE